MVEIDGKIHDKLVEYDEFRSLIINQLGMKVVRFKNEELQDIKAVLAILIKYL